MLTLPLIRTAVAVRAAHFAFQGCALCYNNAAATGPQGARTLDRAILVLLIPVLFLFVSIFVFLYRRRNVQRVGSPFGTVPPVPYRAL
jgi:hypothetical protein